MSTSRGIFDPFATGETNGTTNPFSFASQTAPTSPFAAAPLVPQSPFAAVPDETDEKYVPENGKPAKIPAPRAKSEESPFQIASDATPSFGFQDPAPSPFATVAPVAAAPAAPSPFAVAPTATAIAPAPVSVRPTAPAPTQTLPQPIHTPVMSHADSVEEPMSYRQLELRAIFGVDREMSTEEILQRTRALPGIRHVARIGTQEVVSLENLKRTLQTLGFGNGALRLYSGSVPIEFVRDGATILAVQTDGGFAPGIRETIMIVARELEKMGAY